MDTLLGWILFTFLLSPLALEDPLLAAPLCLAANTIGNCLLCLRRAHAPVPRLNFALRNSAAAAAVQEAKRGARAPLSASESQDRRA